jgi:hypothetical protein
MRKGRQYALLVIFVLVSGQDSKQQFEDEAKGTELFSKSEFLPFSVERIIDNSLTRLCVHWNRL